MSWELFKVVGDWTTSRIVKYDFKKGLHHCCQYSLTPVSFKTRVSLVCFFVEHTEESAHTVTLFHKKLQKKSHHPNFAGYLKMLNA